MEPPHPAQFHQVCAQSPRHYCKMYPPRTPSLAAAVAVAYAAAGSFAAEGKDRVRAKKRMKKGFRV